MEMLFVYVSHAYKDLAGQDSDPKPPPSEAELLTTTSLFFFFFIASCVVCAVKYSTCFFACTQTHTHTHTVNC